MPTRLSRRAVLVLAALAVGTTAGLARKAGVSSQQPPIDQRIGLGDLTLVVQADPWHLSVHGPSGEIVWDEAPDETLNYTTVDGHTRHAVRLTSIADLGEGGMQLVAETDEPAGGAIAVHIRALGQRTFRMLVTANSTSDVVSVGGAVMSSPDEHFVGFGERFDGVDQRGHSVEMWAADRRLAGYGTSTYAPIPALLSSRGYGFALERFERARFDLAAGRPDRWVHGVSPVAALARWRRRSR